MAEVDLSIAGRSYRVACRAGEEDTLRAAAALVDGKSKEALAGLGSMTESRQLLFAALLLADQIIDKRPDAPPAAPATPEPALAVRVALLAERLEILAGSLEEQGPNA
ncbi:MAG: cell division protein ZapA [Sphingomicrobium sp.]